MRRRTLLVVTVVVLSACSGNHSANPNDPSSTATTPSSAPATSDDVTAGASTTTPGDATATTAPGSSAVSSTAPPSAASPLAVTGRAVAGAAGEVEAAAGGAYPATDPFSEAVRLADGTCVGWSGSRGGSTAGLQAGAPVTLLETDANVEIGQGTITASRWEDMAAGGGQWNCLFDFQATLTAPHAEFRIKVAALAPWLARPDSTAPGTYTASVSSDASIGLIPECPARPAEPDPTATTAAPTTTLTPPPTTAAVAPAAGWNAVGQYWSNGVRALCAAGLPVTNIARPCRPPGVGSEYIAQVVDSSDPTEIYANGAAVPVGTELTVVVATGRPCD